MTVKQKNELTRCIDLMLNDAGRIIAWLPLVFGVLWLAVGAMGIVAPVTDSMRERSAVLFVTGATIAFLGNHYRPFIVSWFETVDRQKAARWIIPMGFAVLAAPSVLHFIH